MRWRRGRFLSGHTAAGRGRRVVHIAEAFTGGVARHILELLHNLKGWDQSAIISLQRDARSERSMAELEDLRQAGIPVAISAMKRELSPGSDLVALFRIQSLLEETRPAIVHCHSAKAGFLGRAAAFRAGVPARIYSPHALPFHPFMPPARRYLFRTLERLAGRWTTQVVAVSPSEAEEIKEAGLVPRQRLRLIPNGVEIPERKYSQAEARRKLNIPTDRPIVLCVAHLRPQKAPIDWVNMAQAVSVRRPDAYFLWVGGGELHRPFSQACKARLKPGSYLHLGHQRDPGLAYQAADVFALSSLWEGMPYALLDAMAWGIPCAVTAAAGCRDAIADGQNGLLAAPGDPAGLAAQVTALLADTRRAAAFGAAAQQTVRRDYTLESFLAGHDQLYEDALRMAGTG